MMPSKHSVDFSQLTPEIYQLADICVSNSSIDPQWYTTYKVNRGLRDLNGNGVLTGLTEVSEIQASEIVDGVKVSRPGELYYRGIAIEDLVNGFMKEDRFGFEETTYLLLFGNLLHRHPKPEFHQQEEVVPQMRRVWLAGAACLQHIRQRL